MKSALLLVGVLVLSFAGLGSLSFFFHVPRLGVASTAPRLEISTDRLDLGEGKPNELLRGSLQLRNAGFGVLEFEIAASCGCAELTPRHGTIPAGAEQEVRLAVQLPAHANSERSLRLVVKTNDPKQPEAACLIVAKCPAPFRVAPAFVNFGKISRETRLVKPAEVHIAVAEKEHRRVRTRLSGDAFRVVFSEQPDVIRIAPAAGLDFGGHYGTLELFFEGSEEWLVHVPLQLEMSPPLLAVPPTLTLRKDSAGRFAPVNWILASDPGTAPLGKVSAVHAPPEFRIEEMGRIDHHRHRYRLTIEEGWEAPARFVLKLRDSSTGQRCQVLLLVSSSETKKPHYGRRP